MVKYIKNHIPIKKHQRPGTKSKKNSITIHSTRNTAPAINERNNLARKDNTRTASFHIAVDHNQAIECIPLDEISYHAGNREGNNTSISIEMCEIPGKLDLVIENTIEVTKKIMTEYNIPVNRVFRHYDWPQKNTSWRKPCPYILKHNNWQGWKDFKAALKKPKPKPAPVKKKHWAEKHWESLKRKGITFDEKRFNDTVTRGELFAALDKSLK